MIAQAATATRPMVRIGLSLVTLGTVRLASREHLCEPREHRHGRRAARLVPARRAEGTRTCSATRSSSSWRARRSPTASSSLNRANRNTFLSTILRNG
jgi:hypothetical protein